MISLGFSIALLKKKDLGPGFWIVLRGWVAQVTPPPLVLQRTVSLSFAHVGGNSYEEVQRSSYAFHKTPSEWYVYVRVYLPLNKITEDLD